MGGIGSRIVDFVCKPNFIFILQYWARRYDVIEELRNKTITTLLLKVTEHLDLKSLSRNKGSARSSLLYSSMPLPFATKNGIQIELPVAIYKTSYFSLSFSPTYMNLSCHNITSVFSLSQSRSLIDRKTPKEMEDLSKSPLLRLVCEETPSYVAQCATCQCRRFRRVDDPPQYDDDDFNEERYRISQQQYASVPNTDRIDKHEISFTTKQTCGIADNSSKQNLSVTSMIQKRTTGPAFSTADKCRISNNYLPNKFDLITQYDSKIFCGSHSTDGRFFLTASQDRKLRVYHTHNGQFFLFKTIPAQDVGWSILDTAFSPDGNTIVYSSWSECLYQCSLFGDSNTHEMLSLNPNMRQFCIFSLVFSNDGSEILCGANDGYLYMYDRDCHRRVLRVIGHDADVNAVTFADQSSQIFYSAGDDGLCKVWDKRMISETDPRPVGVLAGHMDGITYIDSRGDSRYLITNSKDQTIKLWDVRALSGKTGQMSTRKAVSGQNWDYRWQNVPRRLYRPGSPLEGDTSIMTYRGHCVLKTLIRCRFSPAATTGQRYIYTGCSSGRVYIYDLLTGKIVRILFGHATCVRDVSWHPFHPYLISTSWDFTVAKWQYRCNERYTEGENKPVAVRWSERIDAQQAGPRSLT